MCASDTGESIDGAFARLMKPLEDFERRMEQVETRMTNLENLITRTKSDTRQMK